MNNALDIRINKIYFDNSTVGKVIMIPNSKTIVVKHDESLSIGDKLEIFEESKQPIIDPDTNEVLGKFSFTKESVEVIEVYPNYAICQNIVTEQRSMYANPIHPLEKKEYKYAKKLNVNPKDNLKIQIKNEVISVGDLARRI